MKGCLERWEKLQASSRKLQANTGLKAERLKQKGP